MTRYVKKNTDDKRQNNRSEKLPIVAIGASAGGLDALKSFFRNVPKDSGLAFVVVVHLAPEHKSMLAELLQPHMKMAVQQVTETIELKPNHVYIIPPNANLNTIDTHLRLSKLEEKRSERAPIDHFFRTLAQAHNGQAVGVILTGTGSDGTLGIREIQEKGGLTIVQDPEEAPFSGMPQSAISTGLVDMILPIDKIPSAIINYFSVKPKIKSLEPKEKIDSREQQLLQKIFTQIRAVTGRDFSRYKTSTLLRRIQRRMQISQVEKLSEYLGVLRKNREEVKTLSDDFLINVTSFFRDVRVFDYIEEKVIPAIIRNKEGEGQIRIWTVGCATGEEAYSIAILLREALDKLEIEPSVQIFASDLHDVSLRKAREGFYPGDINADVSIERLKRFFNKEDGGYRIRKEIREKVIFTPHNLLSDPPFSRLDLVMCRNLLIYLKRDVQKDVAELFHYSLSSHGYLVLGTSENLENKELFSVENKDVSVYKKKNVTGPEPRLPVFPSMQKTDYELGIRNKESETRTYGQIHHKIVERYGPPSLLVSPDYQVLHVSENAGRYLVFPGGEISRDLFKLIRPEMQIELRTVIHAAREKQNLVRSKPLQISVEGVVKQVFISAGMIHEEAQEEAILVLFEEYDEPELYVNKNTFPEGNEIYTMQIEKLEKDLQDTRQQLQAIVEEYETSREEMKASNEEMQSANEELRSTMEELETSKEELQSVNEELTTLNQENRHKVEELSQLSDDLQNLMGATNIATLVLDREFRIQWFTPKLNDLFNIRTADKGRHISDLTHRLGYDDLTRDALSVLKTLQSVEKEIKDGGNNTYLTRLLPYRSGGDKIQGVVITFIDITARKQNEIRLEKMFDVETVGVLTFTEEGEPIDANNAFLKMMGYTRKEYDTIKPGWKTFTPPEYVQISEKQLQKLRETGKIGPYEKEYFRKDGSRSWMLFNGASLGDGTFVEFCFEIGNRKKAEQALRQSEQNFRALLTAAISVVYRMNADWSEMRELNSKGFISETLKPDKKWMEKYIHPEDQDAVMKEIQKAIGSKSVFDMEHRVIQNDGTLGWTHSRAVPVLNNEGEITEWFGIANDITTRKKAEEKLRENEERLRLTLSSMNMGSWMRFENEENMSMDENNAQLFELKKHTTTLSRNELYEHIHPEDRDRVVQAVKKAWEETSDFKIDFRVLTNRSEKWLASRGKVIKGDDQRYMIGINYDITDRKENEKALQYAKEAAEEAARAREDFLAHMSHEIRTPLNAVVGLSQLLMEQNLNKHQAKNVETIKVAAGHLSQLIDSILDLSKLQAGRSVVDISSIDLDPFFDELLNVHRPLLKGKEVELNLQAGADVPKVIKADRVKLLQILHNLLGNAIKFTQHGQVKLEVNVKKQENNKLWLEFSVTDTGIGIQKEKLEEVFDMFKQADSSTVKEYGGTGLGLYITKLNLELMGSSIHVESNYKKGSKFFFVLPVEVGGEPGGEKPHADQVPRVETDELKIMIAEDDKYNRMLNRELFKMWGMNFDEAVNGKKAVELAKKTQYDLILMDVHMPEIDGYGAAGIIRKLPGYQNTPILALTADITSKVREEMTNGLFTDIIIKPIDPNKLKSQIIRMAGKQKAE